MVQSAKILDFPPSKLKCLPCQGGAHSAKIYMLEFDAKLGSWLVCGSTAWTCLKPFNDDRRDLRRTDEAAVYGVQIRLYNLKIQFESSVTFV